MPATTNYCTLPPVDVMCAPWPQVWLNNAEAVLEQRDSAPELLLTLQQCDPSSPRLVVSPVHSENSQGLQRSCRRPYSTVASTPYPRDHFLATICRGHERPSDAFVVTGTNSRHTMYLRGVDSSTAAVTALRKVGSLIPSLQRPAALAHGPPPSGAGSGSVQTPAVCPLRCRSSSPSTYCNPYQVEIRTAEVGGKLLSSAPDKVVLPPQQAPPLRLQEAPQPQLRHERRPSLAEDEALARRLQVGRNAGTLAPARLNSLTLCKPTVSPPNTCAQCACAAQLSMGSDLPACRQRKTPQRRGQLPLMAAPTPSIHGSPPRSTASARCFTGLASVGCRADAACSISCCALLKGTMK